jgi:hypothetical protein
MVGQLIGFLLGILGSLMMWWVFAHLLVPRIGFQERIVARPGRALGAPPRHMIKVSNTGRRDLIDVSFSAIVSIQTEAASPLRWAHCRVAFHKTGEIDHQIPVIPARRNRLLTLYPGHSEQIEHEACFSEAVRNAAADHSLDLATLLRDGETRGRRIKVQVFMFAFDRFSGARKLFQSKEYEASDLDPLTAVEAPAA